MRNAKPPTLEQYHKVVPEWSPRPPMTERLLAALTAAFAHPTVFSPWGDSGLELLWMAVGMKPASQYLNGERVSWASHWRLDEREVGRGRLGEPDPERLRTWKSRLDSRPDPVTQALIDELDEALREAGWRTWRELGSSWGHCGVCARSDEIGFGTGDSFPASSCGSSNLIAVSDLDAARLSLALREERAAREKSGSVITSAEFPVGLALGFPLRSVDAYMRRSELMMMLFDPRRQGDEAESGNAWRVLGESDSARILGWPDELYPYTRFFIADPLDAPIVAEVRRRAEALFGGLPAGADLSTPREDAERGRSQKAEIEADE